MTEGFIVRRSTGRTDDHGNVVYKDVETYRGTVYQRISLELVWLRSLGVEISVNVRFPKADRYAPLSGYSGMRIL